MREHLKNFGSFLGRTGGFKIVHERKTLERHARTHKRRATENKRGKKNTKPKQKVVDESGGDSITIRTLLRLLLP